MSDKSIKFYAAYGEHKTGIPEVSVKDGEVNIYPTGIGGMYLVMPLNDWARLNAEVVKAATAERNRIHKGQVATEEELNRFFASQEPLKGTS